MTLFGGVPVTPGWGGYTYPVKNPVSFKVSTRVNALLCTMQEAQVFLGLVLMQGDIVPAGQPVSVREESSDELTIASGYLNAGYLPLVLEFAGPKPGAAARDNPPLGSSIVPSSQYPYTFSINIGMMYFSAPQTPGSISNNGPQAFRTDMKIQVKADGSFSWVGLDQPTWQGDVSTTQGQ